MVSRNIIRVAFLIIVFFCTCSCKSIVKKIGKETIGEVTEETSEVVAKKGGKAVVKNAGNKVVRNMGWDDLIMILRKENPILAGSLDHTGHSFKKKIADAVSIDYHFLTSLKSSKTLADEYLLFTEQAPKLADNIDFFRLFARADYSEKSLAHDNF